jgi:diadenosine tetraphosphate (Ap4A) HIT family hydrolase
MLDINKNFSLHPEHMKDCEFCTEITSPNHSRFHKIYNSKIDSRILYKHDGFAVMPTIGQLFKGSMLILPNEHYQTMAEIPVEMKNTLITIIKDIDVLLSTLGIPILFEHGAKCSTGSGCGIYHAHIHIVPVPSSISYKDVISTEAEIVRDLLDALQKLTFSDNYLIFRDTAGEIALIQPSVLERTKYPSQYFRKKITEHFQLDIPWNWREYKETETLLTETIDLFKGAYVSIG